MYYGSALGQGLPSWDVVQQGGHRLFCRCGLKAWQASDSERLFSPLLSPLRVSVNKVVFFDDFVPVFGVASHTGSRQLGLVKVFCC